MIHKILNSEELTINWEKVQEIKVYATRSEDLLCCIHKESEKEQKQNFREIKY